MPQYNKWGEKYMEKENHLQT